jgi:hypothetical protein
MREEFYQEQSDLRRHDTLGVFATCNVWEVQVFDPQKIYNLPPLSPYLVKRSLWAKRSPVIMISMILVMDLS